MQFELLTLSGTKYSGQVAEVALKTPTGSLAILPHHEPFTAIVVAGPIAVRPVGKPEELFASFGGIIEVVDNQVRVLADEVEHADDLIEAEILDALERARNAKEGIKDKGELHRAQQLVDRHMVRLEVARIRRHRAKTHHELDDEDMYK